MQAFRITSVINTKLSIMFLMLPALTAPAPEFSDYLQKVLKSHTSHACNGDLLTISCPHKTSISILSAFYGRRVSSQNLCSLMFDDTNEDLFCSSPTALQKLSDECQDRRSCHFSVNSRVFGSDPCPGTSKYLLVSYKCKPHHHRLKTVCENEQLTLTCKNNSLLSIYSASYGRTVHRKIECDSENKTNPEYECSTQTALRKISRRCHRRHNCSVRADIRTFGDPCYPGVVKYLTVSYSCVPRRLMEGVGESSSDPFSLSDYTHGGWYKGPRLSRLTEDLMIFTSCLKIIALIQDVPEKVALYFVCGVSTGLIILLCIFTSKVMLVHDIRKVFTEGQKEEEPVLGGIKMIVRRIGDDGNNDDSSSESSFRKLSNSYRYTNNIFTPELTAALEGVKEFKRQEEDIWPHKGPKLYVTQNSTESMK
ncbi:eva-1 homolog C-like [Pelobates cultripes]|uniref:Eva-1 homolog C-like n=1 Tax=Pelobates cultripes TaxID=61616 RepID=A0AAD1T2V8_PELCU|nr:eva-1 homolog C-like [Pelobates cultripes]